MYAKKSIFIALLASNPFELGESFAFQLQVLLMGPLILGFDVTKERIGSDYNRYLVMPFGGKTTLFRGPGTFATTAYRQAYEGTRVRLGVKSKEVEEGVGPWFAVVFGRMGGVGSRLDRVEKRWHEEGRGDDKGNLNRFGVGFDVGGGRGLRM
ncbi:hypothetical protein IEQ34_017254 [Dendrobium chrysotoxum]|uniref:Uncharacterized protein n=1 Tax=Dendrobium chrysotoxum TaxID=161865 RepID=A0AAV7GB00_DENCH|nr:hypothetical protein IEQ34_017254 [Dendrobium chrysotoxum]